MNGFSSQAGERDSAPHIAHRVESPTGSIDIRPSRRGLMKTLGRLAGAAVVWGRSSRDVAAATSPNQADSGTSDAGYPRYPTIDHLPASFHNYPAPTYIPAGYGLYEMDTDRPDGLLGGTTELSFWYANRRLSMGLNNPLVVWVAPSPRRASPVGNRPGQPVVLNLQSDGVVQAQYHDGFWILPDPRRQALAWNTSNVHSLTFKWREFTISVRGARLANVGYQELVRVASSIGTFAS